MQQFELKYRIIFPVIILICSLFILTVSLIIGVSLNTITGLILLTLSIFMFIKPVIVITKSEVIKQALIGPVKKSLPYDINNIEVNDKGIFIDGKKIAGFFLIQADIEALNKFIKG